MNKKRLFSYLLDIGLLILIVAFFYFVIVDHENITVLKNEMRSIGSLFFNQEISFASYLNRLSFVIHDLDKQQAFYTLVNIVLIIGLFIVIPFFQNGQTIGQKIMKIKTIRNDGNWLTFNDLLIRNIIINGLAYLLLSAVLLYVLPSLAYFIFTSIFGFIQIILVMVSCFMIIYRRDEKGLQDLLSDTTIIKEEKDA